MRLLVLLFLFISLVIAQTSQEPSQLSNDTIDSNESSGTVPPEIHSNSTVSSLPPLPTEMITTTTPKSHGKPPSFTGWSFFLGIIVTLLIVGLIGFACKFWRQQRTTNGVQYATYQAS